MQVAIQLELSLRKLAVKMASECQIFICKITVCALRYEIYLFAVMILPEILLICPCLTCLLMARWRAKKECSILYIADLLAMQCTVRVIYIYIYVRIYMIWSALELRNEHWIDGLVIMMRYWWHPAQHTRMFILHNIGRFYCSCAHLLSNVTLLYSCIYIYIWCRLIHLVYPTHTIRYTCEWGMLANVVRRKI